MNDLSTWTMNNYQNKGVKNMENAFSDWKNNKNMQNSQFSESNLSHNRNVEPFREQNLDQLLNRVLAQPVHTLNQDQFPKQDQLRSDQLFLEDKKVIERQKRAQSNYINNNRHKIQKDDSINQSYSSIFNSPLPNSYQQELETQSFNSGQKSNIYLQKNLQSQREQIQNHSHQHFSQKQTISFSPLLSFQQQSANGQISPSNPNSQQYGKQQPRIVDSILDTSEAPCSPEERQKQFPNLWPSAKRIPIVQKKQIFFHDPGTMNQQCKQNNNYYPKDHLLQSHELESNGLITQIDVTKNQNKNNINKNIKNNHKNNGKEFNSEKDKNLNSSHLKVQKAQFSNKFNEQKINENSLLKKEKNELTINQNQLNNQTQNCTLNIKQLSAREQAALKVAENQLTLEQALCHNCLEFIHFEKWEQASEHSKNCSSLDNKELQIPQINNKLEKIRYLLLKLVGVLEDQQFLCSTIEVKCEYLPQVNNNLLSIIYQNTDMSQIIEHLEVIQMRILDFDMLQSVYCSPESTQFLQILSAIPEMVILKIDKIIQEVHTIA